MLRLKQTPGTTFHILKLGEAGEELLRSFGVDARTHDVETAARVIAGLDLMISVDSMPAHLAGALGVPTWTLLPEPADWRWMNHRNDSRWYPRMRLFRQPEPGDWESVLQEVAAALEERSSPLARRA
jgi:ADP-heptose:LPS heptosyltransferase